MGVQLSRESWREAIIGLIPLMEAHHGEIGEQRVFEPDLDAFAAMDAGGMLEMLVARDGNTMVGYIMWFVSNALDSRRVRVATQGPWYVVPSSRGRGLGMRMLRQSFLSLRAQQIETVYLHHWHHRDGPGLEAMFTRLGARKLEAVFSLNLGV